MSLRFRSILQRIISLHVLALAGAFGAISFAEWFVLGSTANDFEQRLLLDHATTVAEHLQLAGDKWRLDLPPDLAALYGRGYGGYALTIEGMNKPAELRQKQPFTARRYIQVPDGHNSGTKWD